MRDWINLLRPIFLGFKNRVRSSLQTSPQKLVAITSITLVFWVMIFILFQKALLYFRAIGSLGDILNAGLFALLLLAFFGYGTFTAKTN